MWILSVVLYLCGVHAAQGLLENGAARTSSESAPVDEGPFSAKYSEGVPAVEDRYPYVVSLVDGKSSHFCGGVLVSTILVATAAECLQKFEKPFVHIAGVNLYSPKEIKQTVEVIYNPGWRGSRWSGKNIALLKLDSHTMLQPIRFIRYNARLQPGELLYGIGWGRKLSTGSFSTVLQVAGMPFVPTPGCNRRGLMNGNVIPDYMCVGGEGADMCEGDQGAPLIRLGGSPGEDLLMGIAAFHDGTCGDSGKPSIYLRVGLFAPWISEQIQLHDQP